MSTYADTSFLVSLYAPDDHSIAAAAIMAKAELPIFLSSFGELELTNAIHLRVHRKEMTRSQARQALALIRHDITSGIFFLTPLAGSVFDDAQRLSRRHTSKLGVRTLDILHVGTAVDLRAKAFFTFDRRQHALAKAAGLTVLP